MKKLPRDEAAGLSAPLLASTSFRLGRQALAEDRGRCSTQGSTWAGGCDDLLQRALTALNRNAKDYTDLTQD
jgi:hypothetical protein